MNRNQKLTLTAAAASFALSSLVVSWDLSGAASNFTTTRYRLIVLPPEPGP